MLVDFLLGPAGSGKTFRCLAEIRAALALAPEGLPLVFLAPKQATFQLERELLASSDLPGYTRLQILSFDRLAEYILNQFFSAPPRLLSEEGRVMVLRALLAHNYSKLKLFHASARLPGFAQQLSKLLNELQQNRLTPDWLLELTGDAATPQLRDKLHDLAVLLQSYLDWLEANDLQDPNGRLELAADAVTRATRDSEFRLGGLWLDGFSQLTPQELDLLGALVPTAERVMLAFCLDRNPDRVDEWHSMWATISQTFRQCYQRLDALPGVKAKVEILDRHSATSRFSSIPVLAHLERYWAEPRAFESREFDFEGAVIGNQYSVIDESVVSSQGSVASEPAHHASRIAHHALATPKSDAGGSRIALNAPTLPRSHAPALRLLACPDPETEAIMAAREILGHVQAGGRFRDVAVVVRSLPVYERLLARVFNRYGIAFFIDHREPLSHHPLAELTRYSLRALVSNWEHDDWFGALKTGLVHEDAGALDRLENIVLARGWRGNVWFSPFKFRDEPGIEKELEALRKKIVRPFRQFGDALDATHRQPNGIELAAAIRGLWQELGVAQTIEEWCEQARDTKAPASNSRDSVVQSEIHAQAVPVMEEWLDNLELAFENSRLPLGDWLPVVEAGLANLTAGVIPLALDEVLIGQVDRSRNPNLEMALVMGLNETVFPAPPPSPVLLSEHDRNALSSLGLRLGLGQREQIGLERFLGYIACTRPRKRLVLTYSERDVAGQPLNPSPFIDHLQRLFPGLEPERVSGAFDWRESLHPSEVVAPLLKNRGNDDGGEHRFAATSGKPPTETPQLTLALGPFPHIIHHPPSTIHHPSSRSLATLSSLPLFAPVLQRWDRIVASRRVTRLSPGLAAKVYGPELKTSISNLEDYAACPFKFFVVRGLRAEERQEFEVDRRERGSFQHEILMEFHRRLQVDKKRWRDLTPAQASEVVACIGAEVQERFRDGLFVSRPDRRFTGQALIKSLQRFIEVLMEWAAHYQFEPQAVELGFGLEGDGLEPWRLDLGDGHALLLRGRIDRIDLHRQSNGEAYVVVIDYKAGGQRLEQVKLVNGLDLQLLAYLAVLRDASNAQQVLSAAKLIPAGAFYVGLRSNAGSGPNRVLVLAQTRQVRQASYQHRGRFRADLLEVFDSRGEAKGEQFRYSLKQDGAFSKKGNELLPPTDFLGLVDLVQTFLRRYGREIYDGDVRVAPFRYEEENACEWCQYRAICRFDPWVDPYRVLKAEPATAE